MTNYRDFSEARAAAALQEYLDERGPALERLREHLVADGQDPAVFLDGTPESLVPLWRWMLSHFTRQDAPGATNPNSVPPEDLPSWERYLPGKETTLSLETLQLIDGLVSYLAVVVQERAPLARWEFARHRVKGYLLNKHPVLVSGSGETHNFLPSLPLIDARGVLHGAREPRDDAMADHARRIIEQLNGPDENTDWLYEPEPPFEIEEVREGPDGYDFEIGLSDEIAHVYSLKVDWLVRRLSRKAGVLEVVREDRELILVRAPSWSAGELESWLAPRVKTGWISTVMHKIRQE